MCPDGPGIVADVAAWVVRAGGNIVDAGETSDTEHGLFLQRVEFDHETAIEDIRSSFAEVADRWSMDWEVRVPRSRARLAVLVFREGHCLYDLLGRCATGDLPAKVEVVVGNHEVLAGAAARSTA